MFFVEIYLGKPEQECKIFCSFVDNLFCYIIRFLIFFLISISFSQRITLPPPWNSIWMFLLQDLCHPSRTIFSFYRKNFEKIDMFERYPEAGDGNNAVNGRSCLIQINFFFRCIVYFLVPY